MQPQTMNLVRNHSQQHRNKEQAQTQQHKWQIWKSEIALAFATTNSQLNDVSGVARVFIAGCVEENVFLRDECKIDPNSIENISLKIRNFEKLFKQNL